MTRRQAGDDQAHRAAAHHCTRTHGCGGSRATAPGADGCFAAPTSAAASGRRQSFSPLTYWATLASIGASQAAIVSDVTAMALEMSGLARSNLTAAGDNVTALLAARSMADAVEIQFDLARRSLDAIVDGSTKLGEIGLRLANDAAKPLLGPPTAG